MALILTLTDGEGVSGLQAVFGAFINTNIAQTAADAAAAAMSASASAASASASATSATASAASAAAALVSQNAAASSATASATSATASAGSASTAAGSATNAGNSATAAANSATAAAGSATAAGTSATNAANSASAAATTLANALTKANNLSDVASPATARSNLAVPGLTTTNTFTGLATFSGGINTPLATINGSSSVNNTLAFTKGGLQRFNLFNTTDAETGGNAGSNVIFNAFNDAGTFLGNIFTAVRATQQVQFNQRPTFNGAVPWDSSNLAFATPPAIGGTTPNNAAFAALSSSGTFTPSQTNGIVGTTTNNNANAGSIGEYLSSSVTAVSMTSGAASNLTTLPLTPGDWDVVGNVGFVPNSTTVATSWFCGISTTAGSFGPVGGGTRSGTQVSTGQTGTIMEYLTPPVRISVSANTTVYLLAQTGFTVSTLTCNGFIRARRVR